MVLSYSLLSQRAVHQIYFVQVFWTQVCPAKIHCPHMITLDGLSLFGLDVVYIFLIVFVLIRCFVEYVRAQF